LEREAESIARSVMSPFCPGRTVSSCPVAGPWRDDIRRWVGEGVSPEAIRQRLAERVPQHNLMGVPPNRLGAVLPVGLGLLAAGTLFFVLKRLIKPAPAAPEVASKASSAEASTANGEAAPPAQGSKPEDYDARLDDELETLER
jgi:cytochrome c-type biogenesis protein CcmH/NrfF